MTNEDNEWDQLSDYYAEHTPQILGEVDLPQRALTEQDLDDIFAGRPLSDNPRPKAEILAKTYLTREINSQAKTAMERENITMSALLRKALVSYLNS